MIDFRYHVVSIVAVFLALALGLFLGSTTLQGTVTNNLKSQADRLTQRNHTLEGINGQLNNQIGQQNSFAAAVEPYVVAGRLATESVALVSAPGVDGGARSDLMNTLAAAGATVTADIRLSSSYLDPAQDAELGNLARQLAGGRRLPKGTGAAEAGYELAHALLIRPTGTPPAPSRVAVVLNSLSDGKMLTVAGKAPARPATLAVLLVPAATSDSTPNGANQQDTVLIDLAEDLRGAASGVVVDGPTIQPDNPPGPLTAARADPVLTKTVSTVDADETPAGRIATVLALAGAPDSAAGAFGFGKGTAPLPSVSSSP